ncbi:MAG: hypothetical protein QXD66_04870 [Candidatus Nezhaarchaeales archaeon]|nr:MAG: hypothetical protein DSO06_03380 [Candidatus Nezhaarchaeota archaeon WYZ-LMO8]TDA37248.1 MAG: hypothetical protein DSO05_00640 [Candidatus Nezhaarchaeota archaeon WYZ-LMO7]
MVMKLLFKVGDVRDYNLELTLKPSFVSSLYSREGTYWIKRVGLYAESLSLKQEDEVLEAYVKRGASDEVHEVILCESGLWDEKPSSRISKLSGAIREEVKALSELFPGVRLSIAPHDFNCILIAVILSKRTSYEVFVRRWVKKLWEKWHCNLEVIANLRPGEIKIIGTSYQLTDLVKVLRSYVKLRLQKNELENIRRALMLCWGVGPKIADAVLLFTTKSPYIVPCDVHLQRVSKRLGWIDYNVRLPAKTLCLAYYCDECINKYGPCLREVIKSLFPGFGGWIQTLTYLFGSSICTSRKPKCYLCHPILREYCKEEGAKKFHQLKL